MNLDFEHNGVRFNVVYIPGINRIIAHHWAAEGWELMHSKPVPEGMTPAEASEAMCRFITGQIDHDEYNELLPER